MPSFISVVEQVKTLVFDYAETTIYSFDQFNNRYASYFLNSFAGELSANLFPNAAFSFLFPFFTTYFSEIKLFL